MNRRAVYGPRDGTVLSQQTQHRSDDILDGDLDDVLKARRADGAFWSHFQQHNLPVRVQQILNEIGFYGVYRCGRLVYDCHLITALVERWRSETHTFHFRVGEATITLQDVQIIWALPIDGEPVTGLDLDRTTIEWQDYCLTYLGFRPDATAFKGSRLQTHAIISHIAQVEITYDTPHEIVVQYARAVALLLLGGVMCPDSSGNLIPLLYLTKLEDIVEARNYSWGSAVLAFLYRELCNATKRKSCNWWRVAVVTERVYMGQVQTDNNRLLPAAPYGATWNCEHTFTRTVRTTVRVIRDILDEMQSDQPYDLDSDVIMAYAADFNPQLWRSSCPLIFYAIVEMHHPERVLRQFGMRQNIPEAIDTRDMSLHQISRKNRTGTDWNLQHIQYISRWQRRYDTVVQRPPISNRRDTERGYWEWQRRSSSRMSIGSVERDDVGVDLAGPSTVYTPQDYYVPQPPQDDYVPQPPQDDWFQTAPYMPSHAQVHLDLGLGINQPYAPEYNISPVPFPSFSAYRDNVESSSAASSSRLHSNSGGDNNDEQNEPIDDMGETNKKTSTDLPPEEHRISYNNKQEREHQQPESSMALNLYRFSSLLLFFTLFPLSAFAKIAEFDDELRRRAAESYQESLNAYIPNPFNLTGEAFSFVDSRRSLKEDDCKAENPIDTCWRCDPDWDKNRKKLADCARGFGHHTSGGKDGAYYVVDDPSDDDMDHPKPGTLRHAVLRLSPCGSSSSTAW
ncbi:UNVERIFIED_CONTAM: Serine/threonine-protein phosphatase 7 long form [Sesamum radiatum]|uniref:Serine/threonine-protein phosphatase 7 long form n=1 Tax=Sesamum radiatum TaxID=300843 RepID=A0AAW2LR84_SESRA